VPGEGETAINVKVRTEEFGVKTEEVAKARSPRQWAQGAHWGKTQRERDLQESRALTSGSTDRRTIAGSYHGK